MQGSMNRSKEVRESASVCGWNIMRRSLMTARYAVMSASFPSRGAGPRIQLSPIRTLAHGPCDALLEHVPAKSVTLVRA